MVCCWPHHKDCPNTVADKSHSLDGWHLPNTVITLPFRFMACLRSSASLYNLFLPPLISQSTHLFTLLLIDKNSQGHSAQIACSSKSLISAQCSARAQSERNLRKCHGVNLMSTLCPTKKTSYHYFSYYLNSILINSYYRFRPFTPMQVYSMTLAI